jgi:hypothetical protein
MKSVPAQQLRQMEPIFTAQGQPWIICRFVCARIVNTSVNLESIETEAETCYVF